jgi:signal transduction histidine kinase
MSEASAWGRTSIRFRITFVSALLVVVVLTGTLLSLAALQRRFLTENLHDAIEQRADDLTDLLAGGATDVLITTGGEDTVAQVVRDGAVLTASPPIRNEAPLAAAPGAPGATVDEWSTIQHLGRDREAAVVLSRQVEIPDGTVTLHVAGSLGDINEAARILHRALLVLVPAVALLLAAATWWLVGRTLRPVESIRREVDEIGGRELHRRVPQPAGNDEIARLASTMNSMLRRVESAQHAQDRFIADASHELRTPLTRLRTELEIALLDPTQSAASANNRSLLDETIQMQNLVNDLLELARTESQRPTGKRCTVDLDDVVRNEAHRLRALGRRTIDTAGVAAAQVTGYPNHLRRAIANIADNAERHATTTVRFTLHERDGHAHLAVIDDGPGIPDDQHAEVFQRFVRGDPARSRHDGGAGLGLSIAANIINLHRGTITIDPQHHPGTRIDITLPSEEPGLDFIEQF